MKLIAEPDGPAGRRCVIEEDQRVGFYLYVFEGGRCVQDHLQDTLEAAIDQASEDFGVPRGSWKRVEPAPPGK